MMADYPVPQVDPNHIAIVGAGPGVGGAIARRFGRGGFVVTLLGRHADPLDAIAEDVWASGATAVHTIVADAAQPEKLRSTLASLYAAGGAPGVLVYNASILTPDSLLTSSVEHLDEAYDVDVVSAIVAAQVAVPPMRAAGGGIILFTGGGFADYPVKELATVSLGKAALRSAATMLSADVADTGVRVASVTIAGVVQPGTAFDPNRIADTYWEIVTGVSDDWKSEYRFEG
jgi:short-subunit dehydrogenase